MDVCQRRWDYHFQTRRVEYNLGINFRQKPTILKFYGSSSSPACMRHDEENEPNNVSIVSIVPGEAWTLSNRCYCFHPKMCPIWINLPLLRYKRVISNGITSDWNNMNGGGPQGPLLF